MKKLCPTCQGSGEIYHCNWCRKKFYKTDKWQRDFCSDVCREEADKQWKRNWWKHHGKAWRAKKK